VDNEFKVLIDRFASTKVSAYETELFNLKNELERLLLKLRGAEARIAELEAEKTSYSHELRHFREIAEATEKLQLEAQATQAEALKTKEKLEHRLAKVRGHLLCLCPDYPHLFSSLITSNNPVLYFLECVVFVGFASPSRSRIARCCPDIEGGGMASGTCAAA